MHFRIIEKQLGLLRFLGVLAAFAMTTTQLGLGIPGSTARADMLDAFIPRRVNLGVEQSTFQFSTTRSITKTVERRETSDSPPVGSQAPYQGICTETHGSRSGSGDRCDTGGFRKYGRTERTAFSIESRPTLILEFRNNYLGVAFSTFLSSSEGRATLADYPLDQERTQVDFRYWSLAPILYVEAGDPETRSKGRFHLRIGVMPFHLFYVEQFGLTRLSNGEQFSRRGYYLQSSLALAQKATLASGESAREDVSTGNDWINFPGRFLEVMWGNLYFRAETYLIGFEGQKFAGVEKDTFIVVNDRFELGIAFFF